MSNISDQIKECKTSIVFFCKDCGAMIFAAVNLPEVIAGCADEIGEMSAAGHRMAEVSHERVRAEFSMCQCRAEKEPDQLALNL